MVSLLSQVAQNYILICTYQAQLVVAEHNIKLQRESAAAFHISTCAVTLAKDARYFGHAVTFGARLSRFTLDGEEYIVSANDDANSLHGGDVGFDKANWTVTTCDGAALFCVAIQ